MYGRRRRSIKAAGVLGEERDQRAGRLDGGPMVVQGSGGDRVHRQLGGRAHATGGSVVLMRAVITSSGMAIIFP